jgi:hypothetical protein
MVTAPKVINAKTKWRCGQADQDLPRPLRLQHVMMINKPMDTKNIIRGKTVAK